MHFNNVVLPQPDGPTMQTNSPAPIVKLTSPMASTRPVADSYTFRRCSTRSRVLRSATLDLPQSVIPTQDPPLHESEQHREQDAGQSE
jgi:hypothetical protein